MVGSLYWLWLDEHETKILELAALTPCRIEQ
jgi:hypothetical protein